MKSEARLKSLVRPILERNHDLVWIATDRLCLLPVHHMARQICFLRCRGHYFTVDWRLSELFVPNARPNQDAGWFRQPIGRSKFVRDVDFLPHIETTPYSAGLEYLDWGAGCWYFNDSEIADDLLLQIEHALRMMRSLDTLIKCISFMRADGPRGFCTVKDWSLLMKVVLGQLCTAAEAWTGVRQGHLACWVEEPQGHFQRSDSRYRDLDIPLMRKDRDALARIFHAWEAENVKGTRIERFWQPTPFPLERLV